MPPTRMDKVVAMVCFVSGFEADHDSDGHCDVRLAPSSHACVTLDLLDLRQCVPGSVAWELHVCSAI